MAGEDKVLRSVLRVLMLASYISSVVTRGPGISRSRKVPQSQSGKRIAYGQPPERCAQRALEHSPVQSGTRTTGVCFEKKGRFLRCGI